MEVDIHQEHHIQDRQEPDQPKKLKCICELCTCGKHHCPRPRIKGNFSTSYAEQYKNINYPQPSLPPLQYKYEQRHYNPDVMRTSYQDNFKDKPVNSVNPESPSKFSNVGSQILYKIPFSGASSYKEQFKPFAYKPMANPEQQKIKQTPKVEQQPQYYKSPVKFEGSSSYKAQFTEPPKAEQKFIPESPTVYKKVQVPFYGGSSYKNDFPEYKFDLKTQKSQELPPTYKVPSVKFEGRSSYKDQFQGFQMNPPVRQVHSPACVVEKMAVPTVNYINEQSHIYYDPETRKFI